MQRFKTGRAFVFRYAVKLQFSVLFYPLSVPPPPPPSALSLSLRPTSLSLPFTPRDDIRRNRYALVSLFLRDAIYQLRAPENKNAEKFHCQCRIFVRGCIYFRRRLSPRSLCQTFTCVYRVPEQSGISDKGNAGMLALRSLTCFRTPVASFSGFRTINFQVNLLKSHDDRRMIDGYENIVKSYHMI